jgi:predicted transposase/invertase (TIGR01784 family)
MINFGILDIKAEINNGIQCDIEMQVIDYKDIENRLLYYWSKMYMQSIRVGEQYNLLKKTIIVLVSNYELDSLKKLEKTVSKWQIKESEKGKIVLTDKLEFYIIELPKFEKYGVSNATIRNWVKFIESPEVLNMNEIERNKALQKAKEELELISADEKEQYLAEKRFLYMMDKKAIEAAGYDKGMKAGEKQEQIKIAKKMIKNGADIEFVIKCTGLTKEEIEELK